jgi:ABC-type transport system involved in cytochrome c biogenesis permease subunit
MVPAAFSHSLLGDLALLGYGAATAFYVLHLRKPTLANGRLATACAALGTALNLGALWARAAAVHSVPYRDLMGSMALLGFFLGVLNLVVEIRHKDRSLGAFLMPAALLLLLVALMHPPGPGDPGPAMKGSLFALHVTLNMMSYAAFAVAAALSTLYLVVEHGLKSRGKLALTGAASRLPTLGFLARANRTSLSVGILALFIGLSCGFVWAMQVWKGEHPLWALDAKVWMAVFTLVFYAVVVVKARRGASPVTTARLSVLGFVLVLISYTAVNLFVSRVHVFTS